MNRQERSFGIVFGIFFGLFGLYFFLNGSHFLSFVGISLIFFIFSIIFPRYLKKPRALWLKFGDFISKVITPIILLFIFITLIVPTSIILKILRFDPLNKRIDKKAKTYWIERKIPPQSFDNQF